MQENALLMSEWSVTRLDPLCLGSPQGPSHWLKLHIENDQPVACVALLTGTVSGESRGWIAWVEWVAGRSCSVAHQFLLWWHATLCWFDLEWTVGFSENQSLACGVAQDKHNILLSALRSIWLSQMILKLTFHLKLLSICFVRCPKAQEASDRAAGEDGPGSPWREGAREEKEGLPLLGLQILPEPGWNPDQPWGHEGSWHSTGCQQVGGKPPWKVLIYRNCLSACLFVCQSIME